MFKSDLEILSETLDEHIVKALKPSKVSKVEKAEQEISKALSHNPYEPLEMGGDSSYYSPYQYMDGAFMPYSPEHWVGQGKGRDGYLTNAQLYTDMGFYKKSMDALRKLGDLVGEDLEKGGAVPIGTVHTYKDGNKYKKISEGRWSIVSSGKRGKKPAPAPSEASSDPRREKILLLMEKEKREKTHPDSKQEIDPTPPVGDKGKPDNGMAPPPPENVIFIKQGKDLEHDEVEAYIEKFHEEFVNFGEKLGMELREAGASHFGSRLKDADSLLTKMHGRLAGRSLNTVTDVIGARALATSVQNQDSIVAHVHENYDVVEHEDAVSKPREGGYRAHHFLVRGKDGKITELQVKTLRQQVFSGFTHDSVYKIPKNLSPEDKAAFGGAEVKKYLMDLSNHVYKLDMGAEAGERPKTPEVLKRNGIDFPWKELEKIDKGNLKKFDKEETKSAAGAELMKYFVTIRDENKRNIKTKEFDGFDQARDFRDAKESGGHKGELPIGQGVSKEEYLTAFTEYKDSKDVKKSEEDDADLIKAVQDGGVPVGTVHTYRDGQKYKKMAPGKWVPMAGVEKRTVKDYLSSGDPTREAHAVNALEGHAASIEKIKAVLKKKTEADDFKHATTTEAVAQTMGHVKTILSKLFDDGKMPPELEQHIEDAISGKTKKDATKVDPKAIAEKTKRLGRGEGREVKLSKPEVEHLLQSGKFALISAGKNPNHKDDKNLSDAEVNKRHKLLQKDLKEQGYAYTPVKGHYGGEEDSFLVMVHDHDEAHIKYLGKELNQDSVLMSEGGKHQLVYTTGENEGKHHKGEGLDPKGAEAKDNYSEIKTADGQIVKFSLGLDFGKLHDSKSKFKPEAGASP